MKVASGAFAPLIGRIETWARNREDIRGLLILGSRARCIRPADAWSDLDVLLVTTDPDSYLDSTGWLADLGTVWITFLEPTPAGGLERRVLFAGGLDVDFSVVAAADAAALAERGVPPEVAGIVTRGVRVLLDRDGLMSRLIDQCRAVAAALPPPAAPGQAELDQLCHDFWYHAVWVAKKLRRGEVWTALDCCDGYMKRRLLTLLEWHARAHRGPGWDTWHQGRFLEEWADDRVVQALRPAFAHYDAADVRRALLATMQVFRWAAVETSGLLGLTYPEAVDAKASGLVEELLDEP
ncbi:MAG TPA: aminoglycoside 6-adenylyltransferase, partial [Bacillota bacterium]